jgi:hypothetical protein
MSEKDYPSLFQQGKNLAGFTWELLNYITKNEDKVLFVSDEVYKERVSICRSCDRYDELENRCVECGCYVPGKAKINIDSCPLKKWDVDSTGWEEKFSNIQKDMGLDNSEESK